MEQEGQLSSADRILQVLNHLGIERAHFAARMPPDVLELTTHYPDVVASLTLVCPTFIHPKSLVPLAEHLLVITGDQPPFGENALKARNHLADARYVVFPGYAPAVWSDVVKDNAQAIADALSKFLSSGRSAPNTTPVALQDTQGEIAEVFYQIRGQGQPLVLLPLMLAPSGWDPILEQLSGHFCTIVLGGAEIGVSSWLEHRGRAPGYERMIRNLFQEIKLQPGERVLDVGCGSGVVDRWLGRLTKGRNPITELDLNAYLLREAQALAHKEALNNVLDFQQGNAEALPYPENHFDVTFSTTVLEEVDADKALSELIRVTKPGGRVAVIVRATDIPRTLNVPVRREIRAKWELVDFSETDDGAACSTASLYRRFRESRLVDIHSWPQLAFFDNPQGRIEGYMQNVLLAQLDEGETAEYRSAHANATASGTFFMAWPHHYAVGTKSS